MDIEKSEVDDYRAALMAIREACANPFGKDARAARRLASEALARWGHGEGVALSDVSVPKAVEYGGVRYASIRAASKATGIDRKTLAKMVA